MKNRMARVSGLALAWLFVLAALLPFSVKAADAPPDVGCEAYVVMDAATGQVLVEKNADLMEYPASITKILTLGLVLERVDLASAADIQVEVSQAAVDALIPRASMISLAVGEVATVRDLIYATMIESANDASHVLAEYISGSMEEFAALMNLKAQQLGLVGSHFTNPSGQPADDHYVTARDMAAITRWAMGVPGFKEVFGTTSYTMPGTNKAPGGRRFSNANMALEPGSAYHCEGVTGSKTGYTDLARYTLVTTAVRGDMELICVSLNNASNSDKYLSTNAVLDYCFGNFRRVTVPVGREDSVAVPVFGGGANALGEIDVYGDGEISFLLHNDLGEDAVTVQYDVPEKYVIGQAFAPMATVSLAGDCRQQSGGQLAFVPLYWSGLDEIVAANTSPGVWERMAEEKPALFWFVILGPALAAFAIVGRIVWVRSRRDKRRRERLAAARAQIPVRIADRPPPPSREAPAMYRRPSTPNLRVAHRNGYVDQPRRVGRAR